MRKRVGIVTMKVNGLKLNLFVRAHLNENHALYLAELLESGVELPPIRVTEDGQVVDGRHRIEAYQLLNRAEIKAEVVGVDDDTRLIAMAYRANVGGSLPPTADDTEHTVMLLLQRGESTKRVSELLGLPTSMARRYIDEVKSRMNRAQLQQAAAAVTDEGLTVAQAAAKYNVDIEKLKTLLSGHRRKKKGGVAEIQRNLTQHYKSLGLRKGNLLRRLFEKIEDGDVTVKQVHDILDHIQHLQEESSRKLNEWKRRLEALVTEMAKQTEPSKQ